MEDRRGVTIVWLRRDLRLLDNPALTEASRSGGHALPIALWPRTDTPAAGLEAARGGVPGAAARWWLARSLIALGDDLRRHSSVLVVRAAGSGPDAVAAAVTGLAAEAGASRVVWARGIDPPQRAEDDAVRRTLGEAGIEVVVVPSAALLVAPDAVETAQGGPYKVFTPFWRAASGGLRPPDPLPA
ncbi:MAG: deoxyribodipyrimidine photo-lyase, partial [Thermoleophilia bacterium]|nr:deoxyribodipyrimidine photo-lyase [Thermoleophilia bacterium]